MNPQKNVKVAFQGEPGAYSESAVLTFFGSSSQPVPCRRFSDVFRSVETGETEFGVVPIENSIEGSVNQVYDLFLKYDHKVCGEIVLKIAHCLIANPGTKLDTIKVIYSHPQALAQCRSFLENLDCEMISTYDTAGSVKMIKEQQLMDAGAIAGERAAEIYNMNILARNISDTPNNYTRFFVLSKNDAPPSGNDKTSVIFSTRHVPGALYQILGEFAKRKINLTKIESRPTKRRPWEYNFYLDFEGHRTEKHCAEALEGLRSKAVFVKVLGSYPKAPEISNSL
ncbi:bifunctional chorismate mutase/prephenate dehydratase [Candidatus Bathyarchaeota archaeon ex4484_231]|nr:MAG: bifunctional chorismate mutase/prephenate dehydratase [Candidatus Bathyarchaeota archaeon ex4484_231]RJS76488.1 MAG: prephenate dehydratase [Candidatus Bathyarchaeota archaeon]